MTGSRVLNVYLFSPGTDNLYPSYVGLGSSPLLVATVWQCVVQFKGIFATKPLIVIITENAHFSKKMDVLLCTVNDVDVNYVTGH